MIDAVLKNLAQFSPKKRYGHIDIELPVVMVVSGGLLRLRIKKTDTGYVVFCPDNHFSEANEGQGWYFDTFMKNDPNYHYDVKIKGEQIYKSYPEDFNPTVAVNELVRFFILLDDFVINNDVVGNEERFQ